jgi:double-stranded uracil-DNA glycosylase
MEPRIEGFPPIATADARILILGSMPSVRSLKEKEYYAHKNNAFWKIMGELFNAGWNKSYSDRVRVINENAIAVWDVLQSCIRPGSLDSAIRDEVPNDFGAFFRRYPGLRKIGLNGGRAADCFERFVDKTVPAEIVRVKLPSTSRAYARLSFDQKLNIWQAFLLS